MPDFALAAIFIALAVLIWLCDPNGRDVVRALRAYHRHRREAGR